MKKSPIPRIYKSIIRSTQELITLIAETTGNHDIRYHSWDERFEENDLPRETLLGIQDFTFEENGGLWVVRYGLTLSTYHDRHLLDAVEMFGIIHEQTGERSKLKLLDEETGDEVSEMYCSSWELAPNSPTTLRNYKSIGIELLRAGE